MIRTTVVGSYPAPLWLRGRPSLEGLRDATLAVLKTQELAGLDLIGDGELPRFDVNHPETNGMIDYFVRPLAGVDPEPTTEQSRRWRSQPGMGYRARPAGVVVGPIGAGRLDLEAEDAWVAELTPLPRKFTVTSPYMLAKVLLDDHDRDLGTLVDAIAEVLADPIGRLRAEVIQVDEANVTGHPEDGPIAARGINRALSQARGTKAVHLCFGNYGGQTVQQGTYEKLIAFIDALDVDHVVLEAARRPAEELRILAEIRPAIGLGVGVIDVKDNEVERPETVARRISAAAKAVGPERIRYVHPDCGLWMLPRNAADGKLKALVAGRDLFEGRDRSER